MTWLINDATPESQNLSNFALHRATQTPDILTFTQADAYDADPTFEDGSIVTIKRNAAQWFKGTCTAISRRGSGRSERINYRVSGPWYQLQHVIYEQLHTRNTLSGGTISEEQLNLAKIILGSDEDGERIHSGTVITGVVNYALSELGAAAIFQLGTVDVATEMPFEELTTMSCAEIITRCLRWNPDVVAYFDYSTATPTLHFKRRSTLTSKILAHADVVISEANINPRNDLQKDGVQIKFERTNTDDGEEYSEVIVDEAGDISNPFKTLKIYFDLEGGSTSYLKQEVVVETIDETSADWWKKQLPQLAGATNISIADGTRTPVDDGGQNDGTSYTNQLVSGSIADWMNKGVCDQVIKGSVTYTADGETKTEDLVFRVRGTAATSKVYSVVDSSTAAEAAPAGLAASILASLNALHYEGSITLKEQEAGAESFIDKKLNIAGGRAEWAAMDAQVYSVTMSLDAGQTVINFGPAKHLGATDFFQLSRNIRTRNASTASVRLGSASSGNPLPNKGPATVTAGGGSGGGNYTFQVLKVDDSNVKVRAGAINSVVATGTGSNAAASNGMEVWLKTTHDATTQAVTAVAITASDPGANTVTQGKQLLATIAISGGTLTVTNLHSGFTGCKSCGTDHNFY